MDVKPNQVLAALLGSVFVTAGLLKVVSPRGAERALRAVFAERDIPIPWRVLVWGLGVVEFFLGVSLITGRGELISIPMATIMMVGFTVFLVHLRRLGFKKSCGCFGVSGGANELEIARNAVLIAGLIVLWATAEANHPAPRLPEMMVGLFLAGILMAFNHTASLIVGSDEDS